MTDDTNKPQQEETEETGENLETGAKMGAADAAKKAEEEEKKSEDQDKA